MLNITNRFTHPVHPAHLPPHHHPHNPPAPPHNGRHSVVSVQYDNDRMEAVYGELWPFHLEKIACESPEMKIIFALTMGFKVNVNQQIATAMVEAFNDEPVHDFANPALTEEFIDTVASRIDMAENKDILTVILGTTPPGIVAVIASMIGNQ